MRCASQWEWEGNFDMCDYSAEDVPSRNARVGERLVITQLSNHTKGFASPDDRLTAVCLCEGTRLKLSGIPENLQRDLKVRENAGAVFKQEGLGLDSYRDGVVFDSNPVQQVLLQLFPIDLEAEVVSIPSVNGLLTPADKATAPVDTHGTKQPELADA